jgi:hypothetical protein
VIKIELPIVTIAEATRKIEAAKAGKEGTTVAQTSSTAEAGVYGWFLEAGYAEDFHKAMSPITALSGPKDPALLMSPSCSDQCGRSRPLSVFSFVPF